MKKIYIRHTRIVGLCDKGVKKFLESQGLSWVDFVENGLDIDILRKIDDYYTSKVLTYVDKELK